MCTMVDIQGWTGLEPVFKPQQSNAATMAPRSRTRAEAAHRCVQAKTPILSYSQPLLLPSCSSLETAAAARDESP